MEYLKETKAHNKAKFPIKKAKKSLKICRYCDKQRFDPKSRNKNHELF